MRYRLGDDGRNGIGKIHIRISIRHDRFIPHNVDVVDAYIPLLLELEFLKKERFNIDLVDDTFEHKHEGWKIPPWSVSSVINLLRGPRI